MTSFHDIPHKYRHVLLGLIVLLGFGLRLHGLDRMGFNEDEINKVDAARSYLRGNFSVDVEHPMFMKSLVTLSVVTADAWNKRWGARHRIPEEIAVRFPNVVFGSLTAVALFLLAKEFFGSGVALLTALLWSTGTFSIAINRIAKEDTLLVFFTWLAYYFYLRAKFRGQMENRRREQYYAASGVAFGLMWASKYFPYFFGQNFLYYGLIGAKQGYPPLRTRYALLVFGLPILVFLLFNPVILFPSTFHAMLEYVRHGNEVHQGYLMMGEFRSSSPSHLRDGMPIYFYLLFLLIKTPVAIVIAFGVGLVDVVRRWREGGPFFVLLMSLLWIVPYSLLGGKWLRWMLSWMPTIYIIAAIGIARLLLWSSKIGTRWLSRPGISRGLGFALSGAMVAAFLVQPAWVGLRSGPYYTLYLNSLGLGRTAYYFPLEEMNDIGLREAIQKICREAPTGSSVGSEAGPVFTYYFHRFGRDDLRFFDLSDPAQRSQLGSGSYLVVQDGRKYFQNIEFIRAVEASQIPIHTVTVNGAIAASIYRQP